MYKFGEFFTSRETATNFVVECFIALREVFEIKGIGYEGRVTLAEKKVDELTAKWEIPRSVVKWSCQCACKGIYEVVQCAGGTPTDTMISEAAQDVIADCF